MTRSLYYNPIKDVRKNKFTVHSDNKNFQGACQKQPRNTIPHKFKVIV